MPYAIMRWAKIKSVQQGVSIMKHNRRESTIRTLSNPQNKNYVVTLNDSMREDKQLNFRQILSRHLGEQKIRKNAVLGVEIVLTFTSGGVAQSQITDWAKASVCWAAASFGGVENVVSVILHNDESTPHLHVIALPIDDKGKLNCRKFINDRDSCRKLQDTYYEAVKKFGLERGVSKEMTGRRHKDHLKWIADNADKQERLDAYETTFGTEKDFKKDTFEAFTNTLNKANYGIITDEK